MRFATKEKSRQREIETLPRAAETSSSIQIADIQIARHSDRGQKIAWQEIAAMPARPEPPPKAVTAMYRPPVTHPVEKRIPGNGDAEAQRAMVKNFGGEELWKRRKAE